MKLFLLFFISFLPAIVLASGDHKAQSLTLTKAQQNANNIITSKAQGGVIRQGIDVFGTVRLANNAQSHIRARFPGTVKALYVELGDSVTKGQKLAVIEANESLQRYTVAAPMAGLVNESHANLGEFVSEQGLFTIINPEKKWAELQVFPSQFSTINIKQKVAIKNQQKELLASIDNIIVNQQQGLYTARAKITDANWPIATPVTATIFTKEKPVAIRIEKSAVQTIEGKTQVFVKKGNDFSPRPVTLGIKDKDFVEVLDGLKPNDNYVSQGSFLLKADFLKSGAAHHH